MYVCSTQLNVDKIDCNFCGIRLVDNIMSSSDSDSSSYCSSDCAAGWPWQIGNRRKSESDEFDSSSEDSSDQSSVEETTNDSWTNRRNIFISVYKTNNYKDITLITNYNELHNYRQKYTKLSKKNAENIKNIWNEVKVNDPKLGIVPLKSYEKELIEDQKTKNETVKKPTTVSKQNGIVADKTKSPIVTQNQNSKATPKSSDSEQMTIKVDTQYTKNIKEKSSNDTIKSTENSSNIKIKNKENVPNQKKPAETPTKAAKSTEENKTAASSNFTKVVKQDKGVKVDIVVTKSESDKKNKTQSTNSTIQLNGSNTNRKSNSHEQEFKKPQTNSDSKKNKNSKNNTKEIISETKAKKQRNTNSQSSGNSGIQKHSSSVDSHSTLKKKSKKKVEESDNDISDGDDEDEEIIDNMDELTGNSKPAKSCFRIDEMVELVKYKDKIKPVETAKIAEKKTNEKDNNEQNAVKNDVNLSTSEKNNVFNSDKFAEASVDMIIDNNLMGGLESLIEAMQYNPGDDRHYLNRCYCYLQMNKPALALADAQYVLQTSSHYGHRFIAYLRAGKATMALKKYTQAENYFKDSLSINSDNMYAQREFMRAKIARIVSLGYTERSAVLALLKHSKTQDAINYLANKNIAKSDNNDRNYDDIEDSDDLVYSSDVDEKPNCTSLINNMLNYEPIKTKLFHLLSKPITMTATTSLPPSKNANVDSKKKNTTNCKASTGQVIDKALWVGSLTKNITEAVLKKKFKQFGNVVSVYCPPNEAYAFVNFEKSEHVTNVLQNPSAHEINGHKLVIRQGMHKK